MDENGKIQRSSKEKALKSSLDRGRKVFDSQFETKVSISRTLKSLQKNMTQVFIKSTQEIAL